jgi:hypothetical protein
MIRRVIDLRPALKAYQGTLSSLIDIDNVDTFDLDRLTAAD